VNSVTQVDHVEVEALRRKQHRNRGRKMSPSLIGRIGHGGVEVEQELIGEAVDGRRLTECQPESHGALDRNPVRGNCLLAQKSHETGAARMRPHIRMQQVAQGFVI